MYGPHVIEICLSVQIKFIHSQMLHGITMDQIIKRYAKPLCHKVVNLQVTVLGCGW